MSTRAVGIQTALLTYFQERPGKVVTVDMLLKAFPDYDRNQIHGNVYNLRKKSYAKGIEALQRGTWRYVEDKATEDIKKDSNLLLVEVIKRTDQHMVAVDDDGNVYKITLLG